MREEGTDLRMKANGFAILVKVLTSPKFYSSFFSKQKEDTVLFYGRRFVRLAIVAILLIILSAAVIYFTLDVGISSSEYGGESRILDQIEQDPQKGTLGKVLEFFADRSNAVYIYYSMIFLLAVFVLIVLKRIFYMWSSFEERYEIESTLASGQDKTISYLQELGTHEEKKVCKDFVHTLYTSFEQENSRSYFPDLFTNFMNREERVSDRFNDGTRRIMVWVIRLGILGTLVGMFVAFLELWFAMDGIQIGKDKPLTQMFIDQVKMALMGNSVAVATSLTAHASTLSVEVLISFLLRKESNETWLHRTYEAFMKSEMFSSTPKEVSENLVQANQGVLQLTSSVRNLSKSVGQLENKTSKTSDSLEQFNESVNQLQEKLEETHQSVAAIGNAVGGFESQVSSVHDATRQLSDNVTGLAEEVRTLNEESGKLTKLLRVTVESLRESGAATVDMLQKHLATVGDTFNKIRDSFSS
mgnify:FL=1